MIPTIRRAVFMSGIRRRRSNRLVAEEIIATEDPIFEAGDFDMALHAFIKDCKIRNLSEHTIKYYRNELKAFRNMLERQKIDTAPARISGNTIKENVILHMMHESRKETTINARLRAVRAFFNFLEKEAIIPRNPMDGVKLVRQKKSAVQTFSREQLHAILRAPDQRTFTGLRDYAAMLLMVETGLRVKELLNIRLDDIDFNDNCIRVRAPKSYQERIVPFQSTTKRVLRKYIAVRGDVRNDYLFINLNNDPLGIKGLQTNIAKYGRLAGIKNVRCSPHTFRHTFAKMSVQNGANVFELQKMLGHASLEMVRVYVNLFSSDVAAAHKKFSPVEKLNIKN